MTPPRPFTSADLESLARLARLALAPEEKERLQKGLPAILDYFDQLDEVHTEAQPLHHPFDLTNIFREDQAKESLPPGEALGNAAEKEEGYMRAPRIL